jgi:hypothetical protein
MRRVPKTRILRGLVNSGLIQAKHAPQVLKRLEQPHRANELNKLFLAHKGNRFVDKLQALCQWLFLHRETIMSILGFVVMFADDGTPLELVDAETHAKQEAEKAEATDKTPDGEDVYDFITKEEIESNEQYNLGLVMAEAVEADAASNEVPDLGVGENLISREAVEKGLAELVELNQDMGLYDIGQVSIDRADTEDDVDEVGAGE